MFFEAVILRLLKGLSRMRRDYQVRFLGAMVWQHTVLTRQKLISVWMQNEVWCSASPQGLPANANYLNQLPKLLHVNEAFVSADSGYRGAEKHLETKIRKSIG
jgi:hypothetical protein